MVLKREDAEVVVLSPFAVKMNMISSVTAVKGAAGANEREREDELDFAFNGVAILRLACRPTTATKLFYSSFLDATKVCANVVINMMA